MFQSRWPPLTTVKHGRADEFIAHQDVDPPQTRQQVVRARSKPPSVQALTLGQGAAVEGAPALPDLLLSPASLWLHSFPVSAAFQALCCGRLLL